MHQVTPTSSPGVFSATEAKSSSVSSSDPSTSPFFIPETSKDLREKLLAEKYNYILDESSSESDSENMSTSSSMRFQPWMADIGSSQRHSSPHEEESSQRSKYCIETSTMKALHEKFSKLDCETGHGVGNHRPDMEFSGNVREAISLSRNAPLGPLPLCSICQHKPPAFGKPPRWFTFAELELATGGFSQANFLAEGGYGFTEECFLMVRQLLSGNTNWQVLKGIENFALKWKLLAAPNTEMLCC